MEDQQPKESPKEKKIDILALDKCPPIYFEAGKIPNQLASIRDNMETMWEHLWITAKQVKALQDAINQIQNVYSNALTLILKVLGKQNLIHQDDKGIWREGAKV